MINFFIDPYEEEIVSSIFARYHFYNANIDRNDTIEELFGVRNIIAFKTFPSRLKYLESQIENCKYNSEYFIYKHTTFPVYSVFLTMDRQIDAIKCMEEQGSDKVNLILGISTCKFDSRSWYRYCPSCMKADIEKYGEAYFRRIHQIQGVLVCEKHGCKLVDYIEPYKSEIEFTRLVYDQNLYNNKVLFFNKNISANLLKIVQSLKYIIDLEYLKYNKEDIMERIYMYLDKEGYISLNGRVRQKKLSTDITNYYGEELLKLYDFRKHKGGYYFLVSMFSKKRNTLNPIEAIIVIIFLTDNKIEDFFKLKIYNDLPFGSGPWPCLNPICKYHRKDNIDKVIIENVYQSRLPNGVFICEYCEYTYRRKGPDRVEDDKYKKDKVLKFGSMWEEEFKKAIERKEKKKDIIKKFEVYESFVDYYKKNGVVIGRSYAHRLGVVQDNFEEYTNDLKEYMSKHPEANKSKVQKIMGKQTGWLRYNFPEWLEENLPKAQKYKSYSKKKDYEKIDDEMLIKVGQVYKNIINMEKGQRVTITLIERLLNEKINVKLHRIPKTNKFIQTILENVDQYSIRRVTEYCNTLIKENKYLSKSAIINNTAISYSLISEDCKKEINNIIEYYKSKLLA